MADMDMMPSLGVPFRALVDASGIAVGGTMNVAQLAQRGMRAVCTVDSNGLSGGVTVEQLAQRGVRAVCLVDENGLAGGVNADELRRRGIRPLVSLAALGLSGSTTMLQLAQRGLDYACLVNESGAATGGASSEASAFLARTTGLDATHTNAYTALINGLVVDGIWSKLDALYIFATNSSANALLNLVSTNYNCTTAGSPTFTTDRGFTGVETTTPSAYLNSNFNPSTATTPKYIQNSAHVAAWSNTDFNSSTGGCMIGQINGSGNVTQLYPRSADTAYFRINGNLSGPTVASADSLGHYIANRSASNAVQGYKNGMQITSNSNASSAPLSLTMYIMAGHDGGLNAQNGSGKQHCAASIGSSLTSGEALAFYNRLRTYMTAVGVP